MDSKNITYTIKKQDYGDSFYREDDKIYSTTVLEEAKQKLSELKQICIGVKPYKEFEEYKHIIPYELCSKGMRPYKQYEVYFNVNT